MVYDSSRRGMGRVNDYGVVTVSEPYANVIVIGKDASSRITASFHHDPQAPSLVKSVRLAAERGEERFSDKKLSILIFIQEQLGHNPSKPTEIYTHVSTKSLGKNADN
jgi:integrase